MSKYKGLFTFDADSHRFVPIGQSDEIVVVDDTDYVSTEPLIKDEKIRKAVRAWADIVRESEFRYDRFERRLYTISKYISSFSISFPTNLDLIEMKDYTLEELCGEEEE